MFLITLEEEDRETKPGFVPLYLAVVCHVTKFVRAFEEALNARLDGRKAPSLKKLSGNQTFQMGLHRAGRDVPHRIYRQPPSTIVLEQVDNIASPPSKITTTSKLLCVLAAAFRSKMLLWDEVETYSRRR